MELYGVYLAALVLFNVALAYHRHQFDQNGGPQESLALPAGDGKSVATKFKWEYFSLYSIVMAADWLQVSPPPFGGQCADPRLTNLGWRRGRISTLYTRTKSKFQNPRSRRSSRPAL